MLSNPAAEKPKHVYEEEKPEAKQASRRAELLKMLADDGFPESTPPDRWVADCEAYLVASGWRKKGLNRAGESIWIDPVGAENQKGEKLPGPVLAVQGGGTEVVMQHHCPPIAWDQVMNEAVLIQRGRDLSREGLRQQIQRKKDELKVLEQKLAVAPEPTKGRVA